MTSVSKDQGQDQNALAQELRALHKPGTPLLLTNIWDAITASAVAPLERTRALATASFAIAAAAGLEDDDLTLEVNLHAIRGIARVAKQHGKPLTVDLQDGYGSRLEEAVRAIIGLGAVGCNLEDYGREEDGGKGALYDIATAQARISKVVEVAKELGVPDFVVNARTDALLHGRPLEEAVERGTKYLEAGAANVFVWGGRERGGISREEVERLVEVFGGRLNVIKRFMPGALTVPELGKMGVSRISLGPGLMWKVKDFMKEQVEDLWVLDEDGS
ncbi:PEP phosphonomutase-like protein [Clohesyomyces aquaticus]|uniref:PEP phosphonomutase-like protein n=1 Tax=Clohesyomyces aquaticus TaxID=1231657 RepID=A0A1Y2A2Q8_9PLEO|nr:PEP phosphonomutase-like protein [Clohesyomyces aquaticus]